MKCKNNVNILMTLMTLFFFLAAARKSFKPFSIFELSIPDLYNLIALYNCKTINIIRCCTCLGTAHMLLITVKYWYKNINKIKLLLDIFIKLNSRIKYMCSICGLK